MNRDHDQPGLGSTLPKRADRGDVERPAVSKPGRAAKLAMLPAYVALVLPLCVAGCSSAPPPNQAISPNAPSDVGRARLQWTSGPLPGSIGKGTFSPDGEELVVELRGSEDQATQEAAPARLWLVGRVMARCITDGPSSISHLDPQWDPVGSRIAYVTLEGPRNLPSPVARPSADVGQIKSAFVSTLRLLDLSTLESRNVQGIEGPLFSPRWSPDGSVLASCATVVGPESVRGGVVVVNPATGASEWHPLDESVHLTTLLAWLPDGSALVVRGTATRDRNVFRELYTFDLASSSTARIYSRANSAWWLLELAFDPRESALCFVSCEIGDLSSTAIESAVLFSCDIEAGTAREIARLTGPVGWMLGSWCISPDGRGLAVAVSEVVPDVTLPLASAVLWRYGQQSGRIPQPRRPLGCHVVAWSGDSRRIAVAYEDDRAGSRIAVYELPVQP